MPETQVTAGLYNVDTQEGVLSTITVTTTGTHEQSGRVSVATSETTVGVGADIGDAGYLYLKNWDDTNYVQVGFSTGVYPIRLEPGSVSVVQVQPSISSLYCLADTASVDLQYKLWER